MLILFNHLAPHRQQHIKTNRQEQGTTSFNKSPTEPKKKLKIYILRIFDRGPMSMRYCLFWNDQIDFLFAFFIGSDQYFSMF